MIKARLFCFFSSEVNEFVEFYEAFDKIVSTCFGNHLDPDYLVHLEILEKQFHNLRYKETPKFHAMFTYIAHFLVGKNYGLGVFSEQGFEGVHWDLNEH